MPLRLPGCLLMLFAAIASNMNIYTLVRPAGVCWLTALHCLRLVRPQLPAIKVGQDIDKLVKFEILRGRDDGIIVDPFIGPPVATVYLRGLERSWVRGYRLTGSHQ